MNYYVISICGWETYKPIWIQSSLSKKEFILAYKKALHKSVSVLCKSTNKNFITGYDLQQKMVYNIISGKAGKVFKPMIEFQIWGECIYREYDYKKGERDNRPWGIEESDWHEIVKHNDNIK